MRYHHVRLYLNHMLMKGYAPATCNQALSALKSIARRKLFSEARRAMKRQWRQAFRETPNMSYRFWEERLRDTS